MPVQNYDYDYDILEDDGTGSHGRVNTYKIVARPIGPYLVKVKLTTDDKFVDIMEVGLNKDFASYKQKTAFTGSWDVAEFYPEE